ncbi:MAG: RES family NAD+ phosphorylase [Pseudomonadota bacterium]
MDVESGLISSVIDFHDKLIRNIKGIRESQAVFDDLVENEAEMQVAIAAEAAGRMESRVPLITRPFDYGTVITYPFLPCNWQQTRFSDGARYGVWYGSLELETTVYESVHHWWRFVMDSYAAEDRTIIADRRVFSVRCDAILIDLRGKEGRFPQLVSSDYSFTQQLGGYLHEKEQNGLLVKSARCAGVNSAVFTPRVLSSPADVCYLSYTMNPQSRTVSVERERGVSWFTIERDEI